jgi:pilus assembly protein CpaE
MTMPRDIRVYLIDEEAQALTALADIIGQVPGLVVVGQATGGRPALDNVAAMAPDVVVVSLDLRDVDSLALVRGLSGMLSARIIVTSSRAEPRLVELAKHCGALDFVSKPFHAGEAVEAIRNASATVADDAQTAEAGDTSSSEADVSQGAVAEDRDALGHEAATAGVSAHQPDSETEESSGHVITVFGAKGGVGKSTLTVNLASALARLSPGQVVIVDLDLEFGAVAAMLSCRPLATIVDLVRAPALSPELVDRALLNVSGAGVSILAAPPTPDLATEVEVSALPGVPNGVKGIIKALRQRFEWVIIDTAANFRDVNLTAFDAAEIIYLVTTPDIPTLHNTAKCIDVMVTQLGYDRTKVKVVLNHADSAVGLTVQDVAAGLDYPISYQFPRDAQTVGWAANCGRPFVIDRPRTPLAEAVTAMARELVGPTDAPQKPERRHGLFGRRR